VWEEYRETQPDGYGYSRSVSCTSAGAAPRTWSCGRNTGRAKNSSSTGPAIPSLFTIRAPARSCAPPYSLPFWAVLIVERWLIAALRHRQFHHTLPELNQAISELLEKLNQRPFRKRPGSRASLFAELDRPALQPLPSERYILAHWKTVRASIDYNVDVIITAFRIRWWVKSWRPVLRRSPWRSFIAANAWPRTCAAAPNVATPPFPRTCPSLEFLCLGYRRKLCV